MMKTKSGRRVIVKMVALLAMMLLGLLLTGCDGTNAPQLIAAYPQRDVEVQPWTAGPTHAGRLTCHEMRVDCDWRRGAERQGWNPVVTFRAAFAVFLRIFQVLLDGLIWVVVVAGPFVLMGMGLVALWRRVQRIGAVE